MGFEIRKAKKSFRVVLETYSPRKTITIDREEWPRFGFRSDMTVEEAKQTARTLNERHQYQRLTLGKEIRERQRQSEINNLVLPEDLVSKFEIHLKEEIAQNTDRFDTIIKHWHTCQRIISKLELHPWDFADKKNKILSEMKSKKYSVDYVGKLIRMMNLWGFFFSKQTKKFFQPIPKPTKIEFSRIYDARKTSEGIRKPAEPLSLTKLMENKSLFLESDLEAQWNWMYISLAFGLRPIEVDSLKNRTGFEIIKRMHNGEQIQILSVYQSKLISVSEKERWKYIPIYEAEQKLALAFIEKKNFKRPLVKTIRRILGSGYDCYSGRKGFTDLMLARGYQLESIATFLGHRNLDTTWRHYKNKFDFVLPERKSA